MDNKNNSLTTDTVLFDNYINETIKNYIWKILRK